MMQSRGRSAYLDVVKGLLIMMVVLAHSIQFGSGQDFYDGQEYYSDPVFKWIYGFHMPLFMVVSGFLFWRTVNRYPAWRVARSRVRSLLLPIVSWQTLYLALLLLAGTIVLNKYLLYSYTGALWFLWSVLLSSMLVLTGHVAFRDSLLYYVAVWIGLLFVPEHRLSGLHVFLYPYFVMGYLWNKWNGREWYNGTTRQSRMVMLVAAVAVYMLLYFVYDIPERSIYLNGTTLLGRGSLGVQLGIDIVRYLYGTVGIVMLMVAIDLLMPCLSRMVRLQSLLCLLGCHTLGIYIINHYTMLSMLTLPVASTYYYMLTIAETVVMLWFAVGLIWLIRKNRWSRYLLLGEPTVKQA